MASPALKMGVTLDNFHSSGTVLELSERLKRFVSAGAIDAAVPRSMVPEIPSGPDAVLVLCVERSLKTSSWVQVTLESVELDGGGKLKRCGGWSFVKQDTKNLFKRSAFCIGEFALERLRRRLGGVRLCLGFSL